MTHKLLYKSGQPLQMEITKVFKQDEDRVFECWASVEIKDSQGDIVPMDALKKIMPKMMERGGVIMDEHTNRHIGKVLNYEFKDKDGKPGLLLTGKVFKDYPVDDLVWEQIKVGEKSGMSFGGAVLSKDYDSENDATVLEEVAGFEWSLVEKPANPEATIETVNLVAKSKTKEGNNMPYEEEHVKPLVEEKQEEETQDASPVVLLERMKAIEDQVEELKSKMAPSPEDEAEKSEEEELEKTEEEELEKGEEQDAAGELVSTEEAKEPTATNPDNPAGGDASAIMKSIKKDLREIKKKLNSRRATATRPSLTREVEMIRKGAVKGINPLDVARGKVKLNMNELVAKNKEAERRIIAARLGY